MRSICISSPVGTCNHQAPAKPHHQQWISTVKQKHGEPIGSFFGQSSSLQSPPTPWRRVGTSSQAHLHRQLWCAPRSRSEEGHLRHCPKCKLNIYPWCVICHGVQVKSLLHHTPHTLAARNIGSCHEASCCQHGGQQHWGWPMNPLLEHCGSERFKQVVVKVWLKGGGNSLERCHTIFET
eukprot:2771512-Amphidinium_carterae.2